LVFNICSCNSDKIIKLINNLNELGQFSLEKNELEEIKRDFSSESLSEEEIKSVIKHVYQKQKILVDPHTAVAIGALDKIPLEGKSVVLATAHPSKFSNTVMSVTGVKPDLPESLKNMLIGKEKYEIFNADLKKIQNYISKNV
tara:strand:- start:53 stop:481 length:429 start_codon:yes stop_codon:yes gene_type:complete